MLSEVTPQLSRTSLKCEAELYRDKLQSAEMKFKTAISLCATVNTSLIEQASQEKLKQGSKNWITSSPFAQHHTETVRPAAGQHPVHITAITSQHRSSSHSTGAAGGGGRGGGRDRLFLGNPLFPLSRLVHKLTHYVIRSELSETSHLQQNLEHFKLHFKCGCAF